MAYPIFAASVVMDAAASLLNDTGKSSYTYVAQIPYLNIAMLELQEYFELNDIPVTQDVTSVLTVSPNTSVINFTSTPALPSDFVEPQMLWERQSGIDPYVPMTRMEELPLYMSGVEINQFIFYVWEAQEIRLLPAIANIDIKMNYTRKLFVAVTASTDNITVINSQSFLQYRTAGLCAEFIGENKTRADALNSDASIALDRAMGVGTRTKQAIAIRHRPFRSGFKRRTYM